MRDFRTEYYKHVAFFLVCTAVLVGSLLLKELLDSYRSVTEAIWVFAVVLISAGATFYVGAHIFVFRVLKGDTLLQLSTHSPLRRFLVKAVPLGSGFAVVGLISLLGGAVTWPEGDGATEAVAYAVCAKLVSSVALVSQAWMLGAAAACFRGFYLRLFVYMGGFAFLVVLQIATVWRMADLSGTAWAVGAFTSFSGYPVYFGPLGVALESSFAFDQSGPYALGLVLNVLWGVVCFLLLVLRSSLLRRGSVRVRRM